MGKVIFRRIAGRIVPIKVAAGFKPAPAVLQSSAKIRSSLKAMAAMRTSLAEKRIQAINSVRRFVADKWSISGPSKSVFDTSHGPKIPGKNWPRLGMGSSVKANADPLRSGWLVKSGASAELERRAAIKALLSKHGLAPETFHVQTKERDYLVQKIIKPKSFGGTYTDIPPSQLVAASTSADRLRDAIRRRGIVPRDLGDFANVGKHKGKTQALDAGMFEQKRSYSGSELKRIAKFRISGRDYLQPIDQIKLFKRGK